MHDIIAEEMMIPLHKYPHINYKASVRDAIILFHTTNLEINGKISLTRALLVFDDDNHLVGMVRRRDIMRGFQPKCFYGHCATNQQIPYEMEDDTNLLELSFERLKNVIIQKAECPVGEVMIRVTHTVNSNDHLLKIIYEMSDQQYSLLPVLKNGAVVGVIRTIEVMNGIRDILGIE